MGEELKEDILYTAEEIAEKLKITKATVYEMIKRGDLEAHHIGRYVRISKQQFDNYLLKAKGWENVYEGTIIRENGEVFVRVDSVKIRVDTDLEDNVKVSIKPENIILSNERFTSSARNIFQGKVTDIIKEPTKVLVSVDIGIPMKVLITEKSLKEMKIEIASELFVVFKTMAVVVYK